MQPNMSGAPDPGEKLMAPHRRFRAADSLRMVMPLSNANAIWAYYLGIASLIPFASLVIGPVAISFGRKGHRWAVSDPDGQGLRHSIAGIVLAIAGISFTIVLILGAIAWFKFAENRPWLVPTSLR